MERIQFQIDDDLKYRFQLACTEDREKMSYVLNRLIEHWLEERKQWSRKDAAKRR
jgi:predicted transcriptional regulator